jgi:hypothetical protein
MRPTASLSLALLLSLAPAPALARPGLAPAAASTELEREWYGWQVAVFDGLAGLIYLSTFVDGNPELGRGVLGFTGALVYSFGGAPHEGSLPRVVLSTTLRVSAVTTAVFLADRPGSSRRDLTVYLPLAAVSALDIGLLARRKRPAEQPLGMLPYVIPLDSSGIGVGFAGSY